MATFNVGDRIRTKSGTVGVITELCPSGLYLIKTNAGNYICVRSDRLMPYEPVTDEEFAKEYREAKEITHRCISELTKRGYEFFDRNGSRRIVPNEGSIIIKKTELVTKEL